MGPSGNLVIKLNTLVCYLRGTAEIHPSSVNCYSSILAYFIKYFPMQRNEVCNILYNGSVLYKNDLGLTDRTPLALSSVTCSASIHHDKDVNLQSYDVNSED